MFFTFNFPFLFNINQKLLKTVSYHRVWFEGNFSKFRQFSFVIFILLIILSKTYKLIRISISLIIICKTKNPNPKNIPWSAKASISLTTYLESLKIPLHLVFKDIWSKNLYEFAKIDVKKSCNNYYFNYLKFINKKTNEKTTYKFLKSYLHVLWLVLVSEVTQF